MKAFNVLQDVWADESGGSSVGRLAIGLAGAGAGFLIGGPLGAAAFGTQAGFLGGTLLGNIIFPQTLPDIVGSRLDPNKLMVSAYGTPIPIGFGQFVVGGIVAYYPGFKETEIVDEQGAKGGPTQTTRSFTYTGDFRVNLCEGPAEAILKIWANRVLIYDATTVGEPIIDLARLQRAPGVNAIRLYLGDETQLPDPTEQADKGVNATPAYRGIVGIFFQNYPLDDSGGSPPQITALVAMKATEALSTTTTTNTGDGGSTWDWQYGMNSWLSGSVDRIDNTTRTMVRTNVNVNGDQLFPCADRSGNFWSISRGRNFLKFDGITLQQIGPTVSWLNPFTGGGIGDDSLHWEDGIVFGGYLTPEGLWLGEKLFFAQQWFGGSQPIVVVNLDTWDQDGFGGVMNTYIQVDEIEPTLVVDNERFCWFISSNGSISTLSRVNPGDGTVIETHALDTEYGDITFDEVTNSIICIRASSHMMRWSVDSNLEEARLNFGVENPVTDGKNLTTYRAGTTMDGRIFIQTGASLGQTTEFNVHGDMSQGRSYSMSGDFGLPSSTTHRGFFDETRNAIIKRHDISGDIFYLYISRNAGDPITVKEIVDFICLRIGLKASQFDTTNLTQTLIGYLIASRVLANQAIDPLRRFFFFNPISEDFKIKFPILGTSVVATIPEDDLAAGDDGDIRVEVDKLVEQIISEIELPEVLEMESSAENRDFQPQVQRAKRPRSTTNSKRRRLLSFPGTFLTDIDAAQRLETLLYQIWAKRRPVTIRTSQKWLKLSPADVIKVEADGLSHQIILGQIDQGANNVLEMSGSGDDPTTLISVAIAADHAVDEQFITNTAPSQFFILDISLLRDQDDGAGVYVAGAPFSDGAFQGEEILRSSDGNDYSPFAYIPASRDVDYGFATSALADGERDMWDRVTTLTVQMIHGALPSTTEALVLDGAGLLLVGKELLCYATSVDNGSNSYTVSTLLRGRGGTESEMASHVSGEDVIVISADTLIRKTMDLSDQGDAFFYKGITRGGSLVEAVRKQRSVDFRSQWTWAPTRISGSISANDWTVNWNWRNRINGRWRDLIGIASPGSFDYEVDILSGPGGSVLATYTTTASANGSIVTAASHQFFYDNADQVVDFGSEQTTVTFKIYPISLGGIGRGFPAEVTLVGG